MKYTILTLTVALCLALVSSNPLPENGLDSKDVNPESENRVNEAEAESQNNEVRVQFADEPAKETEELTPLSENETEVNEEENRDKRQGTTQSGNFLFDLFRQAADGAARAAGTVYRVVAGTQSLGLGLSASRNVGPAPQQAAPAAANSTPTSNAPSTAAPGAGIPLLTAISSGSDSWGNNEEKPVIGPTQGMTAAISGPLTRLLLIANRGWANLIEDIVLRVAATSERFVNYKAKVINWLI
ncbi:uncharacterized protein LOC126849360 isoform X2 [Cataglyphis hispanica]|uniref:uncharacterized protein LOC126849360 isoform X2 n=1 Tax=Cataglyphis hispanica TaxID=1086592 RepID=UPI00217FDB15|nr:uncharacterized protein LOC126849360 isoform X2 [Cataglyphis hispanica]